MSLFFTGCFSSQRSPSGLESHCVGISKPVQDRVSLIHQITSPKSVRPITLWHCLISSVNSTNWVWAFWLKIWFRFLGQFRKYFYFSSFFCLLSNWGIELLWWRRYLSRVWSPPGMAGFALMTTISSRSQHSPVHTCAHPGRPMEAVTMEFTFLCILRTPLANMGRKVKKRWRLG